MLRPRKKKKMQAGGAYDTLIKDKKVGEVTTTVGNLNLRPIYKKSDYLEPKIENIYDPECTDPDGVGCSKQATVNAQKITGLPYASYAPSNAGYRDAVSKREGLTNVFDQNDPEQRTTANSYKSNWTFPNDEDFSKWKAGDIVTLDSSQNDPYFPYDPPPGYSKKDNSQVSHNGTVVGFTEEGRPIIKHGAAKGKHKGKSWTEVLGKDNRVSDLGHGRYAVKSVWRPKEIDNDNNAISTSYILEKGKDKAMDKARTSSNEQYYLKETNEEILKRYNPLISQLSGSTNRLDTKNKLIKLFNNDDLNKSIQYKLGITAEELNALKPVVYGTAGQESNFNDVQSGLASIKDIPGNILNMGNSKGLFQIKYDSLTEDERRVLNIKSPNDLLDDTTGYKAAILMMRNSKKRMDSEIAKGTHPELTDKDPNFRASYYYNSPARSVNSSDEWGTTESPMKASKPLTWMNWLPGKQTSRNYVGYNSNNQELRMDEGSYPHKLMQQAADLGVENKLNQGVDLENVNVRSMRMKNNKSKFRTYQKGGLTEAISRMGYRDDSPFRDNPYNMIHTPDGTIDMSETGIPLLANGKYLPPYSGMHRFRTTKVLEERLPDPSTPDAFERENMAHLNEGRERPNIKYDYKFPANSPWLNQPIMGNNSGIYQGIILNGKPITNPRYGDALQVDMQYRMENNPNSNVYRHENQHYSIEPTKRKQPNDNEAVSRMGGNIYQQGGMNRQQLLDYLFEGDSTDNEDGTSAPSEQEIKEAIPQNQFNQDEEDYNYALQLAQQNMVEDDDYSEQKKFHFTPYGTEGSAVPNSQILSDGAYGSEHVGKYGQQIYSELSQSLGYKPVVNSIYRDQKQQQQLVSQGIGARNSYHLTGDAVDLKPSDWKNLGPDGQKAMHSKYDVIYHNNHYHLEPKG